MRFEENKRGTDYFCGDLHGCHDALMRALKDRVFNTETDRLFSVGDLVDRGPKNMKTLGLIEKPWFHAVRGNHEDMMLVCILQHEYEDPCEKTLFGAKRRTEGEMASWYMDRTQNWVDNGGGWKETENTEGLTRLCRLAKERMPLWMEIETRWGRVGMTHAEPPEDWADIETADATLLMWNRQRVKRRNAGLPPVKNIDRTVHGHTPMDDVVRHGNSIFIDTALVFGNKLTLLSAEELFAVPVTEYPGQPHDLGR